MERVLVTGSTGFIGRELVRRLLDSNREVHTLERYVTGRYSFDGGARVVNHHASLTDYPAVRNIIGDVRPDYVIHLGAVSAVSFSYDHYIEISDTNYIGTINLAEACYREVPGFSQFIFANTSESYGMTLKSKSGKLTEESEFNPNSPYAVAKVACEMYLRYMGQAYRFPYTAMRPFNTYGRKENAHFFIERTITQMLAGETVHLGDPETVRDWLYVDDHVDGYMKALGNKKAVGESINLCTGRGYTTKETADIIAKLAGFSGKIVWNSTPRRPLDARILIGDNSKAKKLLGWEPRYQLEEGLGKIIEYLKSKKGDARP